MPITREKYIPSFDNLKLLYRQYGKKSTEGSPPWNPKATVCLVHGFGEHSGRFAHVCEAFVSQDFVVHTIDLRGHGYSGGPRADGKFESLLKDVGILLQRADPNLPVYMYGHSMGGLLVLRYLQTHPLARIDGAIIASPFLQLDKSKRLSPFKRILLHYGAGILGEFLVSSNVDPCGLSGVHEEIAKVFHDRLSLPFMTVRFADQLLKSCDIALSSPQLLHLPLLVVHGDRDMVTCPKTTAEFCQKVASVDLTLHIVEGGLHELHNDNQQRHTIGLMQVWLNNHAANGGSCKNRSMKQMAGLSSDRIKIKTEKEVNSISYFLYYYVLKAVIGVCWFTPVAPVLVVAHIIEYVIIKTLLNFEEEFSAIDHVLFFIFGWVYFNEMKNRNKEREAKESYKIYNYNNKVEFDNYKPNTKSGSCDFNEVKRDSNDQAVSPEESKLLGTLEETNVQT